MTWPSKAAANILSSTLTCEPTTARGGLSLVPLSDFAVGLIGMLFGAPSTV